MEAAEAVCGSGALEALAALPERSLVVAEERAGEEPRYRMLETIREYGLERLQACRELEAARRAHAVYYLRLAEEAAAYHSSAEASNWFDLLEREQGNLRAAWQWALSRGDEEVEGGIEMAVRLGWALWRFWTVRGHLSEGRCLLERALA